MLSKFVSQIIILKTNKTNVFFVFFVRTENHRKYLKPPVQEKVFAIKALQACFLGTPIMYHRRHYSMPQISRVKALSDIPVYLIIYTAFTLLPLHH